MRAQRHALMALVSVGLLLTGCGATGDPAADETGDETGAAVTGLGVGQTYTVLGALAELPPASEGTFLVQTADLTSASELTGSERPAEADDQDATRWFGPLSGVAAEGERPAPVFVPVPSFVEPGMQVEEFRDLAGWSLVDVDSYVELATAPAGFTVVAGELADDTLHHLPEVGEGVRTVGEGEDLYVDLTQSSAVSRIGQPVRMGQADGKLALGAQTSAVESWLTGSGPSLADDARLQALAEALDTHDVVSAMLYLGEAGAFAYLAPPSQAAEPPDRDVDFLPDVPFTATAVGWGVEDDRPWMVVAYHYPSVEVAEEAVEGLRTMFLEGRTLLSTQPLSELVELADLTTEGSVAVATLHAADDLAPHRLPQMLTSRDVPFVHQ